MGAVFSSVDLTKPLPPREQVGYLDPEIAGEGRNALLSNGDPDLEWQDPGARPNVPRLDEVKSLAHLFRPKPYKAFPAFLYAIGHDPVIVGNNDQAMEYGVIHRRTTENERAQYGGIQYKWDYLGDTPWRAQPFPEHMKPNVHGVGKELRLAGPPAMTPESLVATVIPQVVAAVIEAMKSSSAPSAPAGAPPVDPKMWDQFHAFKAWQAASQAVADATAPELSEGEEEDEGAPTPFSGLGSALTGVAKSPDSEEWKLWETEAKRLGIEVDGRWSLKTLKQKVEAAS